MICKSKRHSALILSSIFPRHQITKITTQTLLKKYRLKKSNISVYGITVFHEIYNHHGLVIFKRSVLGGVGISSRTTLLKIRIECIKI